MSPPAAVRDRHANTTPFMLNAERRLGRQTDKASSSRPKELRESPPPIHATSSTSAARAAYGTSASFKRRTGLIKSVWPPRQKQCVRAKRRNKHFTEIRVPGRMVVNITNVSCGVSLILGNTGDLTSLRSGTLVAFATLPNYVVQRPIF